MASGASSSWPQRVISAGAPTQRIRFSNESQARQPNRRAASWGVRARANHNAHYGAEPGIKIVAVLLPQIAYRSRRMPSAWMREASVVGFMPSSCAAPRDPETRPPLARRAASMFARS